MARNNNKYIQISAENVLMDLYKKVENVDQRLNSIDKTLERNTAHLEEHMKRSESLETMINTLKEKHSSELKPLQRHVFAVEGGLKILGAISLATGVIAGIVKIFS